MAKQDKTMWYHMHPTFSEMERMLRKAGLPLNPADWTAEQLLKAADLLNNSTSDEQA